MNFIQSGVNNRAIPSIETYRGGVNICIAVAGTSEANANPTALAAVKFLNDNNLDLSSAIGFAHSDNKVIVAQFSASALFGNTVLAANNMQAGVVVSSTTGFTAEYTGEEITISSVKYYVYKIAVGAFAVKCQYNCYIADHYFNTQFTTKYASYVSAETVAKAIQTSKVTHGISFVPSVNALS